MLEPRADLLDVEVLAEELHLPIVQEFARLSGATLERTIGANVRRIRLAAGRSQDQLATACRRCGVPWSQSTVSDIESGDRPLDLTEILFLVIILGVPPVELLAGDGLVWLIGSQLVPLDQLRDLLRSSEPNGVQLTELQDVNDEEAERKAARRLGIPASEVVAIATRLWGRTLTAERDARIGPEANHAARGHVTRQLLAEIAATINPPARPAGARKGRT